MAIFSINDSSLSEYLNEHGGAHRRYAKMIADKDKKLENREEAFRNIGTDTANGKADAIKGKRENFNNDNLKYIDTNTTSSISKAYKRRKFTEKNPDSIQNVIKRNDYIKAKNNFKQDFGGKSKNTINTNDRKPGTYLAAQKKLREAAEYILSVLDESEKKNK